MSSGVSYCGVIHVTPASRLIGPTTRVRVRVLAFALDAQQRGCSVGIGCAVTFGHFELDVTWVEKALNIENWFQVNLSREK